MRRKTRNIENNIDNAMGVNQLFKSVLPANNIIEKNLHDYSENNDIEYIKPFNLKLPKHIHSHIKKMAIDTEKSINELLIEAIKSYYKV